MKAPLGVAHIGAGSIGVLRAQAVAETEGLKLHSRGRHPQGRRRSHC